ncbi:death domain-associated protein 6 isoform X2 [Melanotaenia boesemani]|uniref:death domain-associated protein 6 isoform X2 n=1 Tax=Melanotaenia boesemani TaxID=1250792 RepID=UPI001C05B625|nr:death domain-associated protein 6 isoform X2 [Melanotaenia boesemani]
MAVAPASMADKIIVLDDDEEDSPQPSCSATTSSSEHRAKHITPLKDQQPALTHIIHSPFASAKKDKNVLQAENQKLFAEFVEHCSALTKDCPEVLAFLQTKHAKASPDYLSSVEFRNTLGRCLTHAQAKKSKTFVYINELCTALKQHAVKKRQKIITVDTSTSASGSLQSTSVSLKSKDKTKGKVDQEENGMEPVEEEEEEQPSTSGLQANNGEGAQEAEKKAKRASRKQIAYLENLLKVYNDEIQHLQQAELSLDELGAEDSTYIQEHKLKRKMMKIYEKLCELKGCSTFTGRVIEQKITYRSTRYPEINKRIERFINSPEARWNPPDYPDILQQVLRANERYNLGLSRKQLNQIAQEAFRETGTCIQERRQLDLAYNFGSHLTDTYQPRTDPALNDTNLLQKLRSNREQALSRLEEVITKYANKQEDTEEQERCKRLEKGSKDKENHKSDEGAETKAANGVAAEEEEEEEDDEDDVSSDPDIEEEIQASTQQDGPDDDHEEDDGNEAEQASVGDNKEDQTYDQTGSVSAGEEGSLKDDEEPVTSGSPISDETKSQISPLSDIPSPRDSPSQSEPIQTDDQPPLSNGDPEEPQEPADSSNQVSVVLVRTNKVTNDPPDVVPAAADGEPLPSPQTVTVQHCDAQTNGTSPLPTARTTRSQKRKREERMSDNSRNTKHIIIRDSETDIPLDMGVISCSSPQKAESTRADTPTQDLVSSSQLTPPPKRNKVNVATQCDPDEIIVLSDSE